MDSQQTNAGSSPEVKEFIEKLIEKKDFPDLTPELREQLEKEAVQRMSAFFLERTFETLTEEDGDTFEKMLVEKNSPEELEKFSREHIIDYDTFMKRVFQEFEKEYLEG